MTEMERIEKQWEGSDKEHWRIECLKLVANEDNTSVEDLTRAKLCADFVISGSSDGYRGYRFECLKIALNKGGFIPLEIAAQYLNFIKGDATPEDDATSEN